MALKRKSAIDKINKNGVLLVFPKNNQKEPQSLWSEFHPRTPLKWEWDDDGDDKVFSMWRLMKELSDCRDVVYTKWYQGRATFFSREVFTAALAVYKQAFAESGGLDSNLSQSARSILAELESDSPLSTRDIKKLTELQGKYQEPNYNRAMKDLFSRFLIIAFGEVEDGAFPSLAVGATALLYEDLWTGADSMSISAARKIIDRDLPQGSLFRKFFDRNLKDLSQDAPK